MQCGRVQADRSPEQKVCIAIIVLLLSEAKKVVQYVGIKLTVYPEWSRNSPGESLRRFGTMRLGAWAGVEFQTATILKFLTMIDNNSIVNEKKIS